MLLGLCIYGCSSKSNASGSGGTGGTSGGAEEAGAPPDNGGGGASTVAGRGGNYADAGYSNGSSSESGAPGDLGSAGEAGTTGNGAIGNGCLKALWGGYVQRADGVLLAEGSSEHAILDSSTGLPLAGIVSVQDGAYHGCAAVSDGSAQCWQLDAGNGNISGQLGNGTTTAASALYRATPVLKAAATPLTDVAAVAQGTSNAACAITTAGNLYCWGDLSWIVDNGTALKTGYAQPITTDGSTKLENVLQVALGYKNACALIAGSAANEVWCWGSNGTGELGQSDTLGRQYPIKVLGLTNPTYLVMAPEQDYGGIDATVCALDADKVRCWGNNDSGAAGVNSATTPTPSPTLVVTQSGSTLDNVVDVEPGFNAFAALRSDGTLWQWGRGYANYAANYGVTNIVTIGYAGGYQGNGPRYVTSDGIYHNAMANVTVDCAAL